MSLSTLNKKLKTQQQQKFISYRDSSLNLTNHDIDKAHPKKIGGP